MPDKIWLVKVGQIETCRACAVSFAMRPGESTSALVHRYTDWRESHHDCQLPTADAGEGDETAQPQAG